MIKTISYAHKNINFKGTTIIKGEGGDVLTREIVNAADNSTNGFINTRLNGYSIIVVSDVFEKAEQNYLKYLKKRGLEYIHSTKVIDCKSKTMENLLKIVQNILKKGLL